MILVTKPIKQLRQRWRDAKAAQRIHVYINGDAYTWTDAPMHFAQVVKAWNQINAPRHITGNPGIHYDNDRDGHDGILLPGESVNCKDGTEIYVTPYHNG